MNLGEEGRDDCMALFSLDLLLLVGGFSFYDKLSEEEIMR